MLINVERVVQILGGERTLRGRIRTLSDLRAAVEAGLPIASLDRVANRLGRDAAEAAELKYRIVPKTTLQRRRTRLNLQESERLERLARLTALAEDVWEDAALAREFLSNPQPQLGGERPIDLSRSELGAREVEGLLYRLEYGLPV